MTPQQRAMALGLLIVAVLTSALLAVLGKTDYSPFSTLLAVLAGASISELWRARSAELDRSHKLRMAALDERLRTHQEAYTLWRRLLVAARDREKGPATATECQAWWDTHRLYLDPRARDAFFRAYMATFDFHLTRESRDIALIKADWEDIRAAGDAIVKGVALPAIAEDEAKPLGATID